MLLKILEPYQGYPSAAGCNWLRLAFDEGGVPGEKPLESNLDHLPGTQPTCDLMAEGRVEPGSQRWEVQLLRKKC